MRKIILLFFLVNSVLSYSQELRIVRFEESLTDLTASVKQRNDINDEPCALVRVQVALNNVEFGNSAIIGDVEHSVNQYLVYMPAGTKRIYVNHNMYMPLTVTFADFGVSKLEGKHTYVLVISIPSIDDGKVLIKCNDEHASLSVDGVYLGDVSSKYDIPNGLHRIGLKADGYFDYEGSIIVTNDTKEFEFQMIPKPVVEKKTFTVGGVSFDMIRVEQGEFTMGATKEQQHPDIQEIPTHNVILSDYYIGEIEVTQDLWTAVMNNNPSRFSNDSSRPVEQVSWDDCQEFCKRLNSITGESFRLPTEAEWEYAARGGRYNSGNTKQFAGSVILSDVAWYGSNSFNSTHKVKSKLPNELGIYDMSGNVSEWCSDKYGMYNDSRQSNPKGAENGNYYVIRGGGWDGYIKDCRVASRDFNKSTFKNYNTGFRLAL